MKKKLIFIFQGLLLLVLSAFTGNNDEQKPYTIPPSPQRSGDPSKGYNYLITGDFVKSGIPYSYFQMGYGKDKNNYLNRVDKNATIPQGYNVVTGINGIDVVVPTCLQCHAQVFDGKLVVGLGNTFIDFTDAGNSKAVSALNMLKTMDPQKYAAAKAFSQSLIAVYPLLETQVRGINAADGLAAGLVAHRDAQTLVWQDTALLTLPKALIPSDVPAWWLLKKKNAMFYNGFGRGDFGKFLMASNLLTVSDSAEANEVSNHFGDVLAYIKTIEPPKYPKEINRELSAGGKIIFEDHCSKCHGTYGAEVTYPNLLVPEHIVKTDSFLITSNQQNQQFIDWFNRSWFANGPYPARLLPNKGYVAPPLDGIWITAPYLHNGSVPTLDAVLNSKSRPTYWQRDFSNPEYDYERVGWKYERRDKPEDKKVYNTTLPGYGNYGHYFGDRLTDEERKAVIEYLKTL